MVWISTTLGYIGGKWVKSPTFENFAGVGLSFGGALQSVIGGFTLVLLIFLAIVFLVFVHKIHFKMPALPHIELPKREPKAENNSIDEFSSSTQDSRQQRKKDAPITLVDLPEPEAEEEKPMEVDQEDESTNVTFNIEEEEREKEELRRKNWKNERRIRDLENRLGRLEGSGAKPWERKGRW